MKSAVMNRAWKMFRTNKYRHGFISFSNCLKKAWKKEKALVQQQIDFDKIDYMDFASLM